MSKQRKRNQKKKKKPGGEGEERRGKEGRIEGGKRRSLVSSVLASNFHIISHLDRKLLILTK